MHCNRIWGGSVKDCGCRLPEGGWLECPPEARRVLPKLTVAQIKALNAKLDVFFSRSNPSAVGGYRAAARASNVVEKMNTAAASVKPVNGTKVLSGYTGDICENCGGAHMRRAGVCLLCDDCGSTSGGCS